MLYRSFFHSFNCLLLLCVDIIIAPMANTLRRFVIKKKITADQPLPVTHCAFAHPHDVSSMVSLCIFSYHFIGTYYLASKVFDQWRCPLPARTLAACHYLSGQQVLLYDFTGFAAFTTAEIYLHSVLATDSYVVHYCQFANSIAFLKARRRSF